MGRIFWIFFLRSRVISDWEKREGREKGSERDGKLREEEEVK